MKFNTGKLYQVKQYCWLLYPSKDIAAHVDGARLGPGQWIALAANAECYSQAYSKQYNCKITFASPNDIFCLLEQDGEYIKVLSTNGELGWMIYPEAWTKGCIEEVKE